MTATDAVVLPLERIRQRRPASNALTVSPLLAIPVLLVKVVRVFPSIRR